MATLDDLMTELRALREGQTQLRSEMDEGFRQVRAETQEGFDRVELKVQKVRSDIHQLDKDLNKHMEVHRELEEEIASIKKAQASRGPRPARPRR